MHRNIAVSLILVLMWISRRYTIYFIVGYVAAMLIKAIFSPSKDNKDKSFKNILINFFEISGISLGILLFLFPKFLFHALLTDYRSMYSAYNTSFLNKLGSLVSSFGIVTGLIILVIGILCILEHRNVLNYFSFAFMMLTEIFIFWLTQDMSVHHRMILNLPVFMILIMSLDFWSNAKSKYSYLKNTTVILCIGLFVINFLKSFSILVLDKATNSFFSSRYFPLQRYDMDNLNILKNKLLELTRDSEDNIYVLASGEILNCDILRKLDMPYSDNAITKMFNTHDVDLRDGFPVDFLKAKYIVTTAPVQLHLSSGQEVVKYLANGVQDFDSYI